jgi:hypothetical protein
MIAGQATAVISQAGLFFCFLPFLPVESHSSFDRMNYDKSFADFIQSSCRKAINNFSVAC